MKFPFIFISKISIFQLLFAIGLCLVVACGNSDTATPNEVPKPITPPPPPQQTTPIDSTLFKNKAANIVRILAAADWRTLATHAHPTEGIRFSPYADVNESNLVFTKKDLQNVSTDSTYNWGVFDGSGTPIRYTLADYHEEFIYNLEFTNADKIYYNQFRQHGNMYNTIKKMYPESINIEYYIKGKDPKIMGFDWGALRLVYTKYQENWYLTAIIHSQWTT